MLHTSGEERVDYFWIICSKCKEQVDIRYLGYDPAIPHIELKCPKCKETTVLKLNGHWTGLPTKPVS